jgi:2'-5' RNA ligase
VAQTYAVEKPRAALVSLELLLDPDTEARIRAEWQALADAGLSSLAAHPSPSNRPHITLLVRPSLPQLTREQLREVVALPLPLTIGDPMLFGAGERRVLVRSVVPSEELQRLHAKLHAIAGVGQDAAHTRPGEWTPHISLARRIRVNTIPQALRILDEVGDETARSAEATSLRRWDAVPGNVTDLL